MRIPRNILLRLVRCSRLLYVELVVRCSLFFPATTLMYCSLLYAIAPKSTNACLNPLKIIPTKGNCLRLSIFDILLILNGLFLLFWSSHRPLSTGVRRFFSLFACAFFSRLLSTPFSHHSLLSTPSLFSLLAPVLQTHLLCASVFFRYLLPPSLFLVVYSSVHYPLPFWPPQMLHRNFRVFNEWMKEGRPTCCKETISRATLLQKILTVY